jgi:hypothetical protein
VEGISTRSVQAMRIAWGISRSEVRPRENILRTKLFSEFSEEARRDTCKAEGVNSDARGEWWIKATVGQDSSDWASGAGDGR